MNRLQATLCAFFALLGAAAAHARESFRHHSYFSDLAVGVVCGLGPAGYGLALTAAMQRLQRGD